MAPSDEDGGSSSGRYGVRGTSPDTILGEVRTHLRNQAREIEGIKTKLDEVGTEVTKMTTILPHLVTKENCAVARNATVQDMKDRMDGKSEITGMNITLPELWDKAARFAADEKRVPAAVPPQSKGVTYYIKLTASILSLLGVLIGMTTFVVKTMQRQERTDEILRMIEISTHTVNSPVPAQKLMVPAQKLMTSEQQPQLQ